MSEVTGECSSVSLRGGFSERLGTGPQLGQMCFSRSFLGGERRKLENGMYLQVACVLAGGQSPKGNARPYSKATWSHYYRIVGQKLLGQNGFSSSH